MGVDYLINLIKKPKETGKKSMRQKKANRSNQKKVIQEHVEFYDVLWQLANEFSGINFGQLMSGDMKEAGKELRCIFTSLKSSSTSKKSGRVNPTVILKGDLVLKVVPVQVFGTDASAIIYTGAVTNLIRRKSPRT